jgi:hypothetical protein
MKKSLFLLLLFFGLMANAQNPKFLPFNTIEKDSSLVKFVNLLKAAATNKDIKFVVTQLDKQVSSSFDGENTVETFIQNWGLMEDSTKFWSYLSRALELGGTYVDDPEDKSGRYQVVFPYVYNYKPALDDDTYSMGFIIGKNVNLREKPDTKAKVKTQLSYDVISFLEVEDSEDLGTSKNADGDPEWYQIETYDKKVKGWVNWKFVYSLTGPRLFLFKNQAGKWKISSFVEGD